MPNVDEPGAIAMWVPPSIMFNSNDCTWLVLHKTAGFQTAQACAAWFQNGSDGAEVSAHYVVGLDGTIVQCVPEANGAGGNCCTVGSYAAYLPYCDGTNNNMNLHTISIEHIDPATDNSTPVPEAQYAASLRLVRHICERHNIPMRSGDGAGGVIRHADIDPVNRARCPGNYPLARLYSDLKGGTPVPPTPRPTIGRSQQAADVWNSSAAALGKAPDNTSGIHAVWHDRYMAGDDYGAPTGFEFGTVDDYGAPIRRMHFSTGVWFEYYSVASAGHQPGECHGYMLRSKLF